MESDLGQMLVLGMPSPTLSFSPLFSGAVVPVLSSFQDGLFQLPRCPGRRVEDLGMDAIEALDLGAPPSLRWPFRESSRRALPAGGEGRSGEELWQGLGKQRGDHGQRVDRNKHVVWAGRRIERGSPWWGGGGRAIASAEVTAVPSPISGRCCSLCGNDPAFKSSSWKRDSSCDMLVPGLSHP